MTLVNNIWSWRQRPGSAGSSPTYQSPNCQPSRLNLPLAPASRTFILRPSLKNRYPQNHKSLLVYRALVLGLRTIWIFLCNNPPEFTVLSSLYHAVSKHWCLSEASLLLESKISWNSWICFFLCIFNTSINTPKIPWFARENTEFNGRQTWVWFLAQELTCSVTGMCHQPQFPHLYKGRRPLLSHPPSCAPPFFLLCFLFILFRIIMTFHKMSLGRSNEVTDVTDVKGVHKV